MKSTTLIKKPVLACLLALSATQHANGIASDVLAADDSKLSLHFDTPAKNWEKEALPIGNGRLGAMIFGAVERERIQFNEDSLWIGNETNTGAYQAFGDLFIDFDTKGEATGYRRELDIARAVHTVSYTKDGVNFRREYFASHPAGVMVFRFTADKPGALGGAVSLANAHKGTDTADAEGLTIKGNLAGYVHGLSRNCTEYGMALDYETRALLRNEGGTLEVKDGKLVFKDVDTLTIYLDGDTDYINQRDKKWRGEHPHQAITGRLAKAAATPYAELLAAHVRDHGSLFNRVALDLGKSAPEISKLPTDRRLFAYRGGEKFEANGSMYDGQADAPSLKGVEDPELEALIFQYARYLMIACSRPGDLPANLQGLWNESNNPPWRCDYHANINVQMNYWFVGPANLGECFLPYAEWLNSVIPVRRDETKKELGVRGWATRWENGIFGGATCPWSMGDAAWLSQNLWDHYAFSMDREFLQTRAYPVLKELCEFWEDILKENADGKLVAPPGKSPEHGPITAGNSYDQQLAYDLFTNYIEASKVLGVDEKFREKVETMRSRLLGPKIGKWGQLQEWAEDLDDPKDQHRHLSHMIAVHPGRQITPTTTPELAEAAKVSMNARGDASTGWSRAWKMCVWARLHDGDRAHRILSAMIKTSFMPNLLATHPPFQIDGNFGYAAGVCEMLVQSHEEDKEVVCHQLSVISKEKKELVLNSQQASPSPLLSPFIIHLLPALPKQWASGSVTGLRARGGFKVDIEWKDGKVTNYRIAAKEAQAVNVRVNGEMKTVNAELLQQ